MTALAGLSDLRHFDRAFGLTNRLRVEGTRNLLQIAARTGARRLVAQSFTGWTNDKSRSPVNDETCPLDAEWRPCRQWCPAVAGNGRDRWRGLHRTTKGAFGGFCTPSPIG